MDLLQLLGLGKVGGVPGIVLGAAVQQGRSRPVGNDAWEGCSGGEH